MKPSEDKFYVYAIWSMVDNRIYVGFSKDVLKRLKEHNAGKTKSIKGYRPWKLIHCELITERENARKREIFLKNASGKKWIRDITKNGPVVQGIPA